MLKLKKIIALYLIGAAVISPLACPASVYAAEADTEEELTEKPGQDADSFSRRIKSIIDSHYAAQNARQNQAPVKPVQRTTPAAAAPSEEISEPEEEFTPSVTFNEPSVDTYDFDWQGTPIASSLYAISKIAGKNVVVNGKLEGSVYLSLHSVTYEQALDYLARSFNFNWMEEGSDIIVSTDDKMYQQRVFRVDYVNKEKIKEEFKALGIDENKIYANSETNTVSVTATPYQLQQCERRLRSIDHPVSQCLVLAQLIEISHGKNNSLGMQYSLPTYSHVGNTDGDKNTLRGNFLDKLTFSASSHASRELSKGKVIARPMIMMLNGEEGTVNFGDRVPVMSQTSTTTSTNVTVTYENIGTTLKVTPMINERTGDISMKINCEVSNISKWISQNQTMAPQISTRSAVTSAHLKTGQSFVIGGLMSVSDLDNLSGIPGLMDLPILGSLFRYHSRSKTYAEVYVMITPYIVTDGVNPQNILKAAGGDTENGRGN